MRLKKTQTKRERSKISEHDLAAVLGGRVQPASGALPVAGLKGDVVTKSFLVDDKVTAAGSYSISVALWRKIREQAFRAHKRPAVSVNFDGNVRLFIISASDFIELTRGL